MPATSDAREQIQALHAWWPLPPGDVFRNPDWAAAKKDALARLRAAGYASPSITASAAQVNADDNQVQLTLTLDSGPLYRAGELHIEGLKLHDEAPVRNLAGFGPGAPLTETLLQDYQERLRKANLFDTISVTFDSDPAKADASAGDGAVARAAAAVVDTGRGRQRQLWPARDGRAHAPTPVRLPGDHAQQARIRPRPPSLRGRAQHPPGRKVLSQHGRPAVRAPADRPRRRAVAARARGPHAGHQPRRAAVFPGSRPLGADDLRQQRGQGGRRIQRRSTTASGATWTA